MARMKYIILRISIVSMLFLLGAKMSGVVGGKIPNNDLIDGVYKGTATEGPVKVNVRVTIQDQKVTQIEILSHRNGKGQAAEKVIPDRIIEQQSTDVDAVTNATISSITIMNAIEDAVRNATRQPGVQQ